MPTTMTPTTGAAFIPEIWSHATLDFREQMLVITPLVGRTHESDANFGDTVHVASVTELTARTKAAGTQITYEAPTETDATILINQHKYAAVLIEDILKVQSKYDVREKYTSQFGYVLAKVVDNAMGARFAGFSQIVGVLAADVTEADLRRALQYLDDADAPTDGRAFVFSSAAKSGLMAMEKLVNSDYNGTVGKVENKRGRFGTIWDVPAYVSNNLQGSNAAGHDNALLHKSAIELILQMKVRTKSQFSVDDDGWKLAAFELYGSNEMRDSHGVYLKGK